MSILSRILGSGDVIEKGLDLIDSFHTSDEELIKANTDAKKELLTAYAPFKLAQRYLALMFSFTFLASFLGVLVTSLTGYADVEVIRQVISEFYIGEIMLSIILFYFGGGAFEGIINKSKGK